MDTPNKDNGFISDDMEAALQRELDQALGDMHLCCIGEPVEFTEVGEDRFEARLSQRPQGVDDLIL